MSSPKLQFSNKPQKSVRARSKKEKRGFIRDENGKNIKLCLMNGTGPIGFQGYTSCVGAVKFVSTGEDHTVYSISPNKWQISEAEHKSGKLELKDLKLVAKRGPQQTQQDIGKFILQFSLKADDETIGPVCYSHTMLDENCAETRQPVIKDIITKRESGGHKIWIQCGSPVAKIKPVYARFTGKVAGHFVQRDSKCTVEDKLVKFDMPCLAEEVNRPVELSLRLHIEDDEDISSNSVMFEYLPNCNCRCTSVSSANARTDSEDIQNSSMRKRKATGQTNDDTLSKTFESNSIMDWSESISEVIAPKCLEKLRPRTFDETAKAFLELPSLPSDEKNNWMSPQRPIEDSQAQQKNLDYISGPYASIPPKEGQPFEQDCPLPKIPRSDIPYESPMFTLVSEQSSSHYALEFNADTQADTGDLSTSIYPGCSFTTPSPTGIEDPQFDKELDEFRKLYIPESEGDNLDLIGIDDIIGAHENEKNLQPTSKEPFGD